MTCHSCASGLPLSWGPCSQTSKWSAAWRLTTRASVLEVSGHREIAAVIRQSHHIEATLGAISSNLGDAA